MIFNKDITLYNAFYDKENDITKYIRTYIRGVHIETSLGVKSDGKGSLNNQNECAIYIPFDADLEGKEYISPVHFEQLSEIDRDNYFTFNNDDKIVRGIVDFEITGEIGNNIKTLENNFDDVFNITSIKKNDYGSKNMRHWKVGVI
jgi:hypothetical protein|nr:MAG TPA: hypothetical protein [Caudoviricetes sp.]